MPFFPPQRILSAYVPCVMLLVVVLCVWFVCVVVFGGFGVFLCFFGCSFFPHLSLFEVSVVRFMRFSTNHVLFVRLMAGMRSVGATGEACKFFRARAEQHTGASSFLIWL
jgi:hypothetical protein